VRKYRSSMTGNAHTHSDEWWIEVPEPRGPISFGVFAHEVAHQLLHRGRARVAWRNEIEAWEFALACFDKFGLAGVERSRADAARHLRYVAQKSSRSAKPATARAILERYPEWVWYVGLDPRDAVVLDVPDVLYEIAARDDD